MVDQAPVGQSWVELGVSVVAGGNVLVLEGAVDWAVGSQIVITPTDYDMHEGEVALISNPSPLTSNT
jgi:hypothetical protein